MRAYYSYDPALDNSMTVKERRRQQQMLTYVWSRRENGPLLGVASGFTFTPSLADLNNFAECTCKTSLLFNRW